ncbi:unnamed protein product [Trifolium pratense]|uniref:Uncharacterized protein n=1 Tax=Trifolium pratense TaxID=57577 RepID=A0ACB0ISI8_TRIPR|nr:unnamed protein product [Trifolium pratense]
MLLNLIGRVNVWMSFVLKEKLKGLKTVLKEWNNVEYGDMEARIQGLVVDIRDLDVRGEEVGLSNQEVTSRKQKFEDLWKLLRTRSNLNSITALRVDNVWLESPELIKAAISSFFESHVSSLPKPRPRLEGVAFPMLSEADNLDLTSPFTLEEIELVVRLSDGNKSPGPDGFNFAFVKKFWELLKGDIRIMFDQFHGNACLPKSLLSYFVTLIPKVNSPSSISDFRPISLLGCLYKIIAKVLEKRLSKVIDSLIASNQSAFIKGRNLVDSVLVVNEVVELAKKSRRECLIFKVDFEKAYDSVEWGFLEYMLKRFGFGAKWIEWIRACVFAGNFSVLVNGSPTMEINIKRGLKQGDPLAPFLFLLVKDFSFGRTPVVISHLQYADDTLCIGEASVGNLWTLKAILRGFEMASGLKVNFWKSGLMGVNVPQTFMAMACSFLNCKLGSFPFKYLGLPIGANPRRLSTWDPLLDHLRNRLFSWRNKHISLGGRIILINAVLNAIPIFFLSFMKMPVGVWRKMVRIQREFLWGGVRGGRKISWVKWSVVCKEKSQDGLGMRDVRLVNLSLLSKWRWRLLQPGLPLWKEVLVAKYGSHIVQFADWCNYRIPSSASNWWKDICALDTVVASKNWFAASLERKMGNGRSTHFWLSTWIGDVPLSIAFPRLFSISTQKDGMVEEFYRSNEIGCKWVFPWRRNLFQRELPLVDRLLELLDPVSLSLEEDLWRWLPNPEGTFSVNSSYNYRVKELRDSDVLVLEKTAVFNQIWESPAPSKVIAFSWQLLYDRIPTRCNLDYRGILAPDAPRDCVGCVGMTESSTHLFVHCSNAISVWYAIFRWIGVVIVIPPNLSTLFEMAAVWIFMFAGAVMATVLFCLVVVVGAPRVILR